MPATNEQLLGKRIVNGIDALIELITATSFQNAEDRAEAFQSGTELIYELKALLAKVIGDSEDYIREAIRELVKQRLPEKVLPPDDFFASLEEMLAPSPCDHKRTVKPPDDDLYRALVFLFPRDRIIRNYRIPGGTLEYFIPSCKLAVARAAKGGSTHALRDYLCQCRGIRLIQLPGWQLNSYREIVRYLKRELKQKFKLSQLR